MKKQVFAILLATLLILTTFAACGKKYLVYTDKDGVKHALLTDAEGNTMVNAFGQLVVGVTDKNGKLSKDADGNYETRAVEFPSSISNGNVYETANFKWEVPKNLWYFDENTLYKKDSEINIAISTVTDYENMNALEDGLDAQLASMISAANGQLASEKSKWAMVAGPNVLQYDYEIKDQDGNLGEKRVDIFFTATDGTIYRLLFVIPATEVDGVSVQDMVNMIKFR